MNIRCPECKASTRAPFGLVTDGSIRCVSCGRRHSTVRAGELGSSPEQHSQRVLAFSKEHRIDMASAYSVLLGLMPLELALPFEGGASDDTTPSPGRQETAGEAVAERQPAAGESTERGDRVLYASTLAARHGLSMILAFQVADNRLQLDDALRQMAAASKRPAIDPEAKDRAAGKTGFVAAALVFVGLCGAVVWQLVGADGGGDTAPMALAHRSSSAARMAPIVPRTAAEVRLDAAGRPLAVKALDPDSVLAAYCGASTGPPYRIPDKVVRSGDEYVGYYIEAGIRYAVRIRKEPDGYAAGSASDPIHPDEVARAH